MSTPIYYIKDGNLSFGNKIIFQELEFYLYQGDKICLVGKNGSGKSSLMKTVFGLYELDSGERYRYPASKICYLTQDVPKFSDGNVIDYVLQNLGYEEYKYLADIILNGLDLSAELSLKELSGGQIRRAALAKTLVTSPDILLLDEPTNHLDIRSIEWLEDYIKNYQGAVIAISHDRSFLNNVTNKIWWLDRGLLRKSNQGFKNFDNWQEEIINFEENQLRKLDKKLAEEKLWLQQGVTARRKRNQKRLASLRSLREEHKKYEAHIRNSKQRLEVELSTNENKSKFIIEAENISYSYSDRKIIDNFSIRIRKGEKIGVIGPNGSGKSTLIKLLTNELVPDSGKIRQGTQLEITYFDQHRTGLNPEDSLVKAICPHGGDTVFLKDKEMHVASYLKQFLFDPKSIHSKISTLSGGEQNRLLLAIALINPGNFMILDEPTNDLDMDTLDLLLEILLDYDGTLFVVSHDRDFLEKLVTKTLVFSEDNKITSIYGAYDDFKKFLEEKKENNQIISPKQTISSKQKNIKEGEVKNKGDKISFKYTHLHKTLPQEIDKHEKNIKEIELELSNPDLYLKNPENFNDLSKKLINEKNMHEEKLLKWLEIDEMIRSDG